MIVSRNCSAWMIGCVAALVATSSLRASEPQAPAGSAKTEVVAAGASLENRRDGSLVWVEPGPRGETVNYADGTTTEQDSEIVWRYMCGSDLDNATIEELQRVAAASNAMFNDPANAHLITRVSDNPLRGAGLNISFNADGSVPAQALAALEVAAQYIESLFSDPITVSINVNFANLGGGTIGATGSSYPTAPGWGTARTGMINDKDSDDVIQDWLPTGSTIPVRYVGTSATVTNENRVFFTRANYKATIGTSVGSDASMTFNSTANWDYDPGNGLSGLDFIGVIVHEVGHAMGFTSAVDFRADDIEALDIFRFARLDGTGTDWNPDTYEEFQTTARAVDNNVPNDDANSDLIIAEYRMSDGNPWQASHFREESPSVFIMDPCVCSSNETFHPDFFTPTDIAMFDAIGWDFSASTCGDGILDVGEECDPPNGSTCDINCQNFVPLTLTLPGGAPDMVAPNVATPIAVTIDQGDDSIVFGSVLFYYRLDGGAFNGVTMTHNGGTSYTATLPAADCGQTPEFYFAAQGASTGLLTLPVGAPASFFSAVVGTGGSFQDNFNSDTGWTVDNAGATDGGWQRAIPVNDANWAYDPAADSDGSGFCFLTDNAPGNSDVDNGQVILVSPTLSFLNDGDATIEYDYYLNMTVTGGDDRIIVEISNNDGAGNWVEIARHVDSNGLNWTHHTITQANLTTAGVVKTNAMKVRFIANDGGTQSVVEAGVDAFRASSVTCVGPDTTPPTPNPMTFAVPPAPLGVSSLTMTATVATDASGPVQYFFNATGGGAFADDSGWQASTSYSDFGLITNNPYTYRVKARDSLGNETAYSAIETACTAIETPSGPLEFYDITPTSVRMYTDDLFTDLVFDLSGLFFDSTTAGGDTGINEWIQGVEDQATGLAANTMYNFRLKARNKCGDETAYGVNGSIATAANTPGAPTLSGAACATMNVAVNNTNGNPAATVYAIQCSAAAPGHAAWLNRYVDASGNPSVAAVFRTAAQWGTTAINGLNGSTSYTFRVKARNLDGLETAFGATASLATTACESCSDGVLNQNEVRIDCGGVCAPCECTSDASCGDGDVCDGVETCNTFGQCVGGTPLTCNDGSLCTTDACHPVNGCTFTPITCDDGSACTTDSCNAGTGCVFTPISCDDASLCTTDSCHPVNGCSFTPISCDDDSACTTDSCNAGTGCVFEPVVCNDGEACTIDTCDVVLGCLAEALDCDDANPCTMDSCFDGVCLNEALDCDDDDACTDDSCVGGLCVNDAITCDDADDCTNDSCDSVLGCVFEPFACDTGACCSGGSCTDTAPEDCSGFVCNAFDHQPGSFLGCYGDADGNGVVNAADRGIVSANVGQTDPVLVCINDFDGNGVVNAADRGFVSANIGQCAALPDFQNGSGLNGGLPDTRFGAPVFHGLGTTCAETTCP
jgi:hypothetical protein